MKADKEESEVLENAIDKIQDGIENVVELYNKLEQDKPLINFDQEVLENLEKANRIFGEDYVSQRINTILKEVLTWLNLDEFEDEDNGE